MNQGLEDTLNAILFPRIVRGGGQRGLRCLLGSSRLLLNVQHIEFGTYTCAICIGSDSELSQPRFEFQQGVRNNQMAVGPLAARSLPSQKPKSENELVLLSKS